MTESLFMLATGYAMLLALVTLALVHSHWHWLLKTGLIVSIGGFCLLSYHGWKQAQGWPASARLPEHFILHYAVIEESPDEPASGKIFLWLSTLEDFKIAKQPRAYVLPYDRVTHGKIDEALRRMKQGKLQIGTHRPSDDAGSQESEQHPSGQRATDLLLSDLPDPALPEK